MPLLRHLLCQQLPSASLSNHLCTKNSHVYILFVDSPLNDLWWHIHKAQQGANAQRGYQGRKVGSGCTLLLTMLRLPLGIRLQEYDVYGYHFLLEDLLLGENTQCESCCMHIF